MAVECGPISELNGQSKMSLRAGTNIQGRERPESHSFAELLVDVEEALPAWVVVFVACGDRRECQPRDGRHSKQATHPLA